MTERTDLASSQWHKLAHAYIHAK